MQTETITKRCLMCGNEVQLTATVEQWNEFYGDRHSRRPVQDIFPEMSPGNREMLLSGICSCCFDKLFHDPEEDDGSCNFRIS